MTKLIRTIAVLGAVWSLLVTFAICLFGLLMGMTDRFNGPHTLAFLIIGLAELALLFALIQAYKFHRTAGPLLFSWFVIAAGLLSWPSGIAGWFDSVILFLVILAPVTLTMILSMLNGYSRGPKT